MSDDLSDVLSEFARTMVTDFPIQGILDQLVQRIVDIMPITAAGVTLITPDTDPRYVAASSQSALRFEQLQTELREGPCLAAYHTGAAVAVPELAGDARFAAFAPRAVAEGLAAVFTFPLRHGAVQLGALDLYRDVPGPLSPEALRSAQTLADVAAAYLLNAQARTDLQDSSDEMRDAAVHDALTGLPNRLLLLERLEHALLRARRSRKTSAVIFVDLDGFKAINDTHGHEAGDEVLVAVARRLTEALRPGDTLARLGGDEFVILCEGLSQESEADAIAVRIDAALSRPLTLGKAELRMGASIGVAFTSGGEDAPEQLIHDADLAMYRAKSHRGRGEDGQQAFSLRRLHAAEHQAGLQRSLRGAAMREELQLAFQPIVDAGDRRLTGVEALVRWHKPSGGTILPDDFISLAEQSGAIIGIGRWVLGRALADRRRWQEGSAMDIALSVNVSARELLVGGFADRVAAALGDTATEPGHLTLEVTESLFARDGHRARIALDALKAVGVRLALDDFGTGYSSLSYLADFPLDVLKIDRSFVERVADEAASQTIVRAITEMAHGLGMSVVAEGVETAAQHRVLTDLGCDACQGYHFARPMSDADLTGLLRATRAGTSLPRAGARRPDAELPDPGP